MRYYSAQASSAPLRSTLPAPGVGSPALLVAGVMPTWIDGTGRDGTGQRNLLRDSRRRGGEEPWYGEAGERRAQSFSGLENFVQNIERSANFHDHVVS